MKTHKTEHKELLQIAFAGSIFAAFAVTSTICVLTLNLI